MVGGGGGGYSEFWMGVRPKQSPNAFLYLKIRCQACFLLLQYANFDRMPVDITVSTPWHHKTGLMM